MSDMSDVSLTARMCNHIRDFGPLRSPALREAFPDCKNPAALLAGPIQSGYLMACKVIGTGANGRVAELAEYRLSEAAGKSSYEEFKARGLPPPATSAAPLKFQPLRVRASREGLEQPALKRRESPAKKGPPPLNPWPGSKPRAVFKHGNERFVSAAGVPDPAQPASPPAEAAPLVPGLITDPKFVLTSLGELLVYQGSTQVEFTALAAQQLADFVGRVRSAIDAAVSNNPGAPA